MKESSFETWSESELKKYLDSYGVKVPQGSKINELRAFARKQATYFRYGTSTPTETAFAKISAALQDGYQWVMGQINAGSEAAKQKVKEEL